MLHDTMKRKGFYSAYNSSGTEDDWRRMLQTW